jgi:excisionase family DNA binding protein
MVSGMSMTATFTDTLSQADRLLTVDEVAARLAVTPRTIRRWADEGKLEHVRLAGYTIRFTAAQVESLRTSEAPAGNGDFAKIGGTSADDGQGKRRRPTLPDGVRPRGAPGLALVPGVLVGALSRQSGRAAGTRSRPTLGARPGVRGVTPAAAPATRAVERVALAFAAAGYFVFPCCERDKRSLTSNGFKAATRDEAQILRWWDARPGANPAAACGASGLTPPSPAGRTVVVDRLERRRRRRWLWLWPARGAAASDGGAVASAGAAAAGDGAAGDGAAGGDGAAAGG